jgi:plastocyanin
MGIVVAFMSPDKPDGTQTAPAVDPFTAPVDNSDRCTSGGLKATDPTTGAATPTLCPNGIYETHGTYAENTHFTGPTPGATISAADGPSTSNISIGDFQYTPGDLTTIGSTGIPTVKLGTNLTFTNADAGVDIPHTITSCAYPCIGTTGADFPVADGSTSSGRSVDLDSGQLGYWVPAISGTKQNAQWSVPVTASNGYQPGEIVTFYCRVHPGMRGAFKVVQ